MPYDFDQLNNRKNTYSYKWDQSAKLFGRDDILPLWVADMDFKSSPAILEAMEKRNAQGVYGYTVMPDEALLAVTDWFKHRHSWDLRKEWLTSITGIVTALSIGVELFSEPGAPVILQSPVYYPFYDVIRMNGRQIAVNPLVEANGRYEMDYDHLEKLMLDGAKLILLCNPHNPGGRVWSREELLRLGELCLKHGVTVVSDEIHADMVFEGSKHIPFASLSPEISDITVSCIAPTKTFNLPGLPIAFMATENHDMKRRIDYRVKALSLHMTSFFTPDLLVAAYRNSEQWLDELMVYLRANLDYAIDYLQRELPEVKPMNPEGSYLLWVDCGGLGLTIPQLKELMYQEAKVAFNEGSVYGDEGKGFLRVNVGCPRSTLEEGLRRFVRTARAVVQK